MGSIHLIINPAAGRGLAAQVEGHVRNRLEGLGVAYTATHTTGPREAIALAERAAMEGAQAVVAVGGDGTVNEVLNGLVRAHVNGGPIGTLGVIPAGSGNDFEYMIHTDGIEGACRRLAEIKTHLIDVGRIDNLYFANGVGIGFDAVVNIRSRHHRSLRGLPLYLLAVLETTFVYYKAPTMTLDYDGTVFTAPMMMVSVTNGRRFGGGFLVTPEAQIDDGLFDLCLCQRVGRLRILSLIPHFIRGTHTDKPEVTMTRARKIVIASPDGLAAHVDGEIYATNAKRIEMEILPKKLKVIVG